jgi:hypothetical protein
MNNKYTHWEDLNDGDIIYYIILNSQNINSLIENNMRIEESVVKSIRNDGTNMIVNTEEFEDIIISYQEFFEEGFDTVEESNCITILSVNYDGIKSELNKFLNDFL